MYQYITENNATENGWAIKVYPQSVYIGDLIQKIRHGIGTLIFHSGIKYEGEWSKGSFQGRGSITYPDGIQYEGQWNMDKPGCMDCFIF